MEETMKHFVKLSVLTMTFALAFVLVACGGSNASSSASASSASTSSASASASSASTSASSAATDSITGTVSGDTYKNEFFGVQYTLPTGFTFFDDAKLAELNGAAMTTEEAVKALQAGAEYYDAAAASEAGPTVTISILYAGTPEAKALDAAGFVEAMAKSTDTAATGVTVKDAQAGAYQNGQTGEEYPALKRTVENQGQTYAQEIIVVKAGDYFLAATATSSNEADLDSVLCNFSTLK